MWGLRSYLGMLWDPQRHVGGNSGRLFFQKTVSAIFVLLLSIQSGCLSVRSVEVDSTDDPAVLTSATPTPTFYSDSFSDGVVNSSYWVLTSTTGAYCPFCDASVPVVEASGVLSVSLTYGLLKYNGLTSKNAVNFTGKQASVEVVQVTSNLAPSSDTDLGVSVDLDNGYSIYVAGNNIFFAYKLAGTWNDTSIAYDSVQHRYWKIQHQVVGDLIEYSTSPDGVTWTVRRSIGRPIPITSVYIDLVAGSWAQDASPAGTGAFDHFFTDAI